MKIDPLRLGLHYSPPTVIVEYRDDSSGKRYHRRIGLPFLTSSDDSHPLALRLKDKFSEYLGEVSTRQLERLIKKLQDNCDDAFLGSSSVAYSPLISDAFHVRSPSPDLNKATPDSLASAKKDMDVQFFANRLNPGDHGFIYDKVVNFDRSNLKPSGWDEDIQL
jgi:CEP19-like protein